MKERDYDVKDFVFADNPQVRCSPRCLCRKFTYVQDFRWKCNYCGQYISTYFGDEKQAIMKAVFSHLGQRRCIELAPPRVRHHLVF